MGSCAVNIPYMVGKEQDFLEDVAVITGSTIINNDGIGISLQDIQPEHFGTAVKVIVGEDETQIIGGGGTEEAIAKYKEQVVHKISMEESKHFQKIMKERLTRLNQIQAVIGVGGRTQAQIGENRDLIVDSLNSARAALEHGVLPGGGAAMFHASKLLPAYVHVDSVDENVGVKIFQDAMKEPLRRIITNAVGENSVGTISNKVDEQKNYLCGYNIKTEKVENMYEAGILDSYKVISGVLEDSVGLASMIIMTEVNVIKRKEYTPTPLSEHQKYREFF